MQASEEPIDDLPRKAVILARGLGTRLRAAAPDADLTDEQTAVAAAGIKALMPVAGDRTMLDLMIGNLVAAGFSGFCLVIGDEHSAIRDHCERRGLNVSFAIQKEALGTSDAVLAASSLIAPGELFLVVNSDNLYPVNGLRRLRAVNRPAMIGFSRAGLIANSNIPADRIARFATIDLDAAGDLRRILEKPEKVAPDSCVSMNAWLFSDAIFDACRAVGPSTRGEFEITAAVQYAIDRLGAVFAVVRSDEGVLDLSTRSDIAGVAENLRRE